MSDMLDLADRDVDGDDDGVVDRFRRSPSPTILDEHEEEIQWLRDKQTHAIAKEMNRLAGENRFYKEFVTRMTRDGQNRLDHYHRHINLLDRERARLALEVEEERANSTYWMRRSLSLSERLRAPEKSPSWWERWDDWCQGFWGRLFP